ncbi:DsbA family protein [Gulosibacter bifidus]|uniref:DsbA family protein n=1 Tax=Gulosibacter bifidus TaxID=272239 RepID=A0ABW5RJW2_9MICO|nr:thioredoxin domain-containing protein [Gulosibacter bifidus]
MASKDRDRIRRLREEANQLRKQEEARKRRSRLFAQVGIVVGALVVVGLIATLVIMGPRWFGNQVTPEASAEVAVETADGKTTQVPISVGESGVTVGKADAKHTIDYYFDFSCPHCLQYHEAMDPHYKELIASGDAKVNYHIIRFVAQYGQYAGASLYSAVSADPTQFYTYVDALFAVPAETQMGYQMHNYVDVMKGAGVSDEAVLESIKKGEYTWFISDATERARAAGIPGTPSIVVDGKRHDNLPYDAATLEKVLNGEELPDPSKEDQSMPGASGGAKNDDAKSDDKKTDDAKSDAPAKSEKATN